MAPPSPATLAYYDRTLIRLQPRLYDAGIARLSTTHTGSLPRPADLAKLLIDRDQGAPAPGLSERVRQAVAEMVARQAEIGIDILNDGEMGRVGFSTYVKDRLGGFEGESGWVAQRRPELDDHPDFAERWKQLRGGTLAPAIRTPACNSPITVKDPEAIQVDIANLKAATASAGVAAERLFMTAASPGTIGQVFANRYYPTREAFLWAVADAMRHEYEAIVAAGFLLQLDCPDLAHSRHSLFADLSEADFVREIELSIAALNYAVRNIPPEAMRLHVCWGNYEGPHDHDVQLRTIVATLLRARPAGISLESSNPRHGHEWRIWEDVPLPDGKYLVPGVIDSTNNYVEHPELVAQRLLNYVELVGPESVIAGSDCGFGTNTRMAMVAPSVAWSKLRSLVEGAELASRTAHRVRVRARRIHPRPDPNPV